MATLEQKIATVIEGRYGFGSKSRDTIALLLLVFKEHRDPISKTKVTFPPNWQAGEKEIEAAKRVGLTADETVREVVKFIAWASAQKHRGQPIKRNWYLTWVNWVKLVAERKERSANYAKERDGREVAKRKWAI